MKSATLLKPRSQQQHRGREAAYPRCIGAYNPSPRIVGAGGADAHTPTTPHQPSPTATRKKLVTLSARCSSVSCCAGISVQFSNNHACLLSPFALSMYPTIITQRLRCSGSATGIVFGVYVTDPILNFVCNNRCMYTTVYGVFFCYNRQQQHAVSVISTVSREDSSSTNLQK